jgi:hypothetical protein
MNDAHGLQDAVRPLAYATGTGVQKIDKKWFELFSPSHWHFYFMNSLAIQKKCLNYLAFFSC